MKNAKEMMGWFSLVNAGNRTSSKTSTTSIFFLTLLALLAVGSTLPSNAQSALGRGLPWASDSNYGAIEIQSACQVDEGKHATWITDVRNTTDSTIQVKAMGKTLQIDGNSSIQLDPIAVKGCKKPLKLKLDARAVGDRDHYALDYNDGVVKAHHKSPTDWMGMTAAIMAGVSAGMGNPVPLPDPPAADSGDDQ
jgi:hypothetical protein